MADITVKVNPVSSNTVKQVAIGQVAAENFELGDLKNVDTYNTNLFSTINNEEKRTRLMKAIDYTNIKYGRHALSIAQAGFKKKWNTRRQHDSKIDTASFQLLPTVRA